MDILAKAQQAPGVGNSQYAKTYQVDTSVEIYVPNRSSEGVD